MGAVAVKAADKEEKSGGRRVMMVQEQMDQVKAQGAAEKVVGSRPVDQAIKTLTALRFAHEILTDIRIAEKFAYVKKITAENGAIYLADAAESVASVIAIMDANIAKVLSGEDQPDSEPVKKPVKMLYDTAEKIRELASQPRRKKVLFGLTKAQALFLYNLAKLEHRAPAVERRIKMIESDPGEIIYARLCYYNAQLESFDGKLIATIKHEETVKFLIDRKIGGVEM
jgi:hypothetical protein